VPCRATDQRVFGYVTLNYQNRRPMVVPAPPGLTPGCRASDTTYAPFKCKHRLFEAPDSRAPYANWKGPCDRDPSEFEQAQTELVGKAVVLTDGKAGTVEKVWLDESHGLRISIRCHDGKWPISTIKFAQEG
jgi:hypothetical protein